MRTDRRRRTALGALALAAGFAVASCGSDAPGELADVRWQVSRVEDAPAPDSGTAVASSLSQTDQARTFLVVGGETMTGSAGCMALTGSVEWLEDNRVRFHDLQARDASDDQGGVPCQPNDSTLADRLVSVLGEDSPELDWSTPGEDELRLTRSGDEVSDWQTPRFVELIATP
ncbi:MAG: hypothetical protein ACTH1D_02610 [Mycobacteriaceae bacterium]|uniref:hypothetical protein n=1 Tax=Corynebacterium sp. TaxID=1720 RepID=UPI003F9D126B